jgi:hypothetical protein
VIGQLVLSLVGLEFNQELGNATTQNSLSREACAPNLKLKINHAPAIFVSDKLLLQRERESERDIDRERERESDREREKERETESE